MTSPGFLHPLLNQQGHHAYPFCFSWRGWNDSKGAPAQALERCLGQYSSTISGALISQKNPGVESATDRCAGP